MAGIFQSGAFFMGFDMDPTAARIFTQAATGAATASVTPAGFGYSWQISGGTAGILLGANLTTLIVGFMYYASPLPSSSSSIMCTWYDATAGAAQVTLRVTSTGSLQFYLGSGTGTPIGPASSSSITGNAWNYFEATVTISATVGFVECKLNGATIITTAATQNTKSTANTFVNAFQFQPVGASADYADDWYMLDTTGSAPFNTYLGPVQVRGDKPNNNSAVGGRNAFTPTNPTNVNYTNVGNTPANAAEYNADSTPGDYDMFRFPSLPSNVTTVLAVDEWALLVLDSAGARTAELDCYSNGTDSPSAAVTPPTGSAAYFNQVSVVDPHTGSPWTVANAGVVELGVKVQT